MDRIKLYSNLARWIPLLTPPADYAAEAVVYQEQFFRHDPLTNTILELGCVGGHNASHLKKHFKMTLTDISPEMLALSRKLNPECEHCMDKLVRTMVDWLAE